MIVKNKYFTGENGDLEPSEMFTDGLWWICEFESSIVEKVVHVNPMLLKAENIFKDALKK